MLWSTRRSSEKSGKLTHFVATSSLAEAVLNIFATGDEESKSCFFNVPIGKSNCHRKEERLLLYFHLLCTAFFFHKYAQNQLINQKRQKEPYDKRREHQILQFYQIIHQELQTSSIVLVWVFIPVFFFDVFLADTLVNEWRKIFPDIFQC